MKAEFVLCSLLMAASSAFADVYLVETNPNAQSPYDSWATAATSFSDAKAVLTEGATLWISNGTYSATAFTPPANTTIRSVNGPSVTTLNYAGKKSGFTLSNAGTVLAGIRVYNAYDIYNGGVTMTAASAVVTNCILESCSQKSAGGGVNASAGLVVDCTITKCNGGGYSTANYNITAVNLTGSAVMDRCRIVNNPHEQLCMGIVGVSGSAILRNSLVTGNNVYRCSGVRVWGNGTVENCTIAGNTTLGLLSDYDDAGALYVGSLTATVRNSIVCGNVDRTDTVADVRGIEGFEACLSDCHLTSDGDPVFVDAAVADYHLQPISPCLAAGTVQTWMADAKDLDGNPRTKNDAVDLGCYEYTLAVTNGAEIYRRMIGATPFAPQTNEFRAVITPAGLAVDPDKCWWTFDGTEPSASNYAKKGLVVTNELAYGLQTVRFRYEFGGETYGRDKTDWFLVHNSHVYLVKTNPNATAPYDTWATAATSFEDAFGYLNEGMTLVISNGTYALATTTYTVPKYATIRSENGAASVTLTGKRFLLERHGSTLEGLTIKSGGCLNMTQSCSIKDCVFDSCNGGTVLPTLNATAGEIIGCTFKKCTGYTWSQTSRANMLDAIGPVLIDRCQILDTSFGYESRGAVYVESGAAIRNSFFFGNKVTGCSALYVGANGRAENCSIISNTCVNAVYPTSYAVYAAAGSAVTNVLVVGNKLADGTIANIGGTASAVGTSFTDADGDPKFTDVEKGDYTLSPSSPCLEAGTTLPWMTPDSIDLAGHPRVYGKKPDIGCYEFWESSEVKLTLYRNQLGAGVYAPQPWEFSVLIQPMTLEYDPSDCWWTFDGSVPTAENHAAEGTTVTNVFMAATNAYHTVSFALKVGDEIYYNVQTNWIYVLNDVVYLVTENANAAPPYATRETAATNFTEAIGWLRENGTLWISNGTYAASTVAISKNGAIRSENGPEATMLDFRSGEGIKLSNADSTLAGLTITKAFSSDFGGVTVTASGCVVTNCVFDSCSKRWAGGGVNASAGLVVDCSVTNCDGAFWEGDEYGIIAVSLSGTAVMDRCRVYNNTRGTRKSPAKGIVGVSGSAVLRNTLVATNRVKGCCGVWVSGNGKVENCTVAGNVSKGSASSTQWKYDMPACAFYVDSTTAGITNTIISMNVDLTNVVANVEGVDGWAATVGTSLVGGDPRFKSVARGDFHLRLTSPCFNAGRVLPWMEGAKDLGGVPRVRFGTPDIGAYEVDRRAPILIVR